MRLFLDTETYCETPITNGTHVYAQGAQVMIVTWAVDADPPSAWDRTEDHMPIALHNALQDADEIIIHNSAFDRAVMRASLGLDIKTSRVFDTMACALAHSLPGSLATLGEVFGLAEDNAKDKAGGALIQLFCKPRPKSSVLRRATRETHPDKWQEFIEYAKSDITAMREIYHRLPRWNYSGFERDLWELDQKINERGVYIDMPLVAAAIDAVGAAQASLSDKARELTHGDITSARQRDALIMHIARRYGITLHDLTATTVERHLANTDTPAALRELILVRQQATTSSTAKYAALARATSADGRLRGTLQFCGAARTGRWSGRLFQPQNLPRPTLPSEEIDVGISALKSGHADLITDNIMALTSSAIRGCIIAPEGKKLVVADLSNIEGRVLAWLAEEDWKLQAYRDYDAGVGPDLYKLAYAKSFGVAPENVTKSQRQIGKVQELALGYEGGVGAFATFATAYRLDLDDMAMKALATVNPHVLDEARSAWRWALSEHRTLGLSENAYLVCDAFKRSWRQAHPKTAQLWKAVQNAVRAAIAYPGATVRVNALKIRVDGAWLRIGLPSGRALCYPQPETRDGVISYMGVNQFTRKWDRILTYGGKLVENVTQAAARDILAEGLVAAESGGYAVVLSIHDEILAEVPDTPKWCVAGLCAHMTATKPYRKNLPLAAAGFEANRYKKED